jgi:hypothetical protein
MCSAFWRGVTLLKESDSDVGSASSGPSRDTEGFSGAPKNASLLEPVISKLIDKVARRVILSARANAMQDPPKGASPKWVSYARENAQWLKNQELIKKKKMDDLFRYLEDETARVESLIRENEEQ